MSLDDWSDRELSVVGEQTYATLRLLAASQHMTPSIIFLPWLVGVRQLSRQTVPAALCYSA
jgi:hypothetical protein